MCVGPFAADHDDAVAEPHLGMELVGAVDAAAAHDEHGRVEAESAFEPFQGGDGILVAEGGNEGLPLGHRRSPMIGPNGNI